MYFNHSDIYLISAKLEEEDDLSFTSYSRELYSVVQLLVLNNHPQVINHPQKLRLILHLLRRDLRLRRQQLLLRNYLIMPSGICFCLRNNSTTDNV